MRPDLTSAEIAMSGSYFDDVLRDPRRYGSENTTDKVRRRGAVRRRRDAVCTERIVSYPDTGQKTAFWEMTIRAAENLHTARLRLPDRDFSPVSPGFNSARRPFFVNLTVALPNFRMQP